MGQHRPFPVYFNNFHSKSLKISTDFISLRTKIFGVEGKLADHHDPWWTGLCVLCVNLLPAGSFIYVSKSSNQISDNDTNGLGVSEATVRGGKIVTSGK